MTTAVLPADRPREDARRTGPCATEAGAGLPQGVVRAGLVVLGAQAVGLCAWSTFLWSRFALTRDAGSYLHVAYVISGGHLDGTALALHFDLLLWPMSLVTVVWRHGPLLLWEQDLATVAVGLVGFRWVRDLLERALAEGRLAGRQATGIAGVFLVVVAVEPWIYLTDAYDVHPDVTVATLFVMLAGLAFWQGRTRTGWIWAGLTLLNGDVAGLLVVGLGVSALLAGLLGRSEPGRRGVAGSGAALCVCGIGWELLLAHLGRTGASPLWAYRYLVGGSGPVTAGAIAAGVALRPVAALRMLWAHRVDLYASLAPAGLVGVADPWCIGVPLVALAVADLAQPTRFGVPSFQTFPAVGFAAVGLASVLVWLAGRGWGRGLVMVAGTIVAANAVIWGSVWLPRIERSWPGVTAGQAGQLSRTLAVIPSGAEVVAEQGVIGRFAQRPDYHELIGPGPYPVAGRFVWFVVTPGVGVELMPPAQARSVAGELAGPLHAHLVADRDGVVVFRWRRPAGVHRLRLASPAWTVPAWTSPGPSGRVDLTGPARTWHVAASPRPGDVVTGTVWHLPSGRYRASLRLSSEAPTDFQVWDRTTGVLLAHGIVPPTPRARTRSLAVVVRPSRSTGFDEGWGLFSVEAVPGLPHDEIGLSLLTTGAGSVQVDQFGIAPAGPTGADAPGGGPH